MMYKRSSPVIYGEVLYDCFPDGNVVLGGAPFNVAWHCQAFGLNPIFISRVGSDQKGEQIKQAMHAWGMTTEGLQLDDIHPTGIVDVKFNNAEPAYDIVKDSAWDFIDHESLPKLDEDTVLYHGSLVLRNDISANTLSYLKEMTRAPVFVDINLRAPWWDIGVINKIISDCRWLKLNEEELGLIMSEGVVIEEKMKKLLSLKALDMLIVTQGEKGVLVADSNGDFHSFSPELTADVVDTVGAGDSFSSVLLLGQYRNWPLQTTLLRAQQFASAVVGVQGATINDKEFYKPFIEAWKS